MPLTHTINTKYVSDNQDIASSLDSLHLAGINYRTAPVAEREKLAIPKEKYADTLPKLAKEYNLKELVVLSTCNRTEFYFTTDIKYFNVESLFDSLTDNENCKAHVYTYNSDQVVNHLFKLVCGLDSMVLGETQISHQIKHAYEAAKGNGYTSLIMNQLFQKAFQVAKSVHTTTSLSKHCASIPSVALEFARAIFGELEKTSVLIIGTGEMAELTLLLLEKKGVKNVGAVSRSAERALIWGREHNTTTWPLEELPNIMRKYDIIISCTNSQSIISPDLVLKSLKDRKYKSMLFLDLGMPRNINPAISQCESVYLYNIDDLQQAANKNMTKREKEAEKAMEIISHSAQMYIRDSQITAVTPLILQLRSKVKSIADSELERTFNKLTGLKEKERNEIQTLIHRTINKILHEPTEALRQMAQEGKTREIEILLSQLLGSDIK